MKHTPGPWESSFNGRGTWQIIGDMKYYKKHICNVESSQFDAHLIASAPDLLEACRIAYSLLPGPQNHDYHNATYSKDLEKIKRAIAKAEGN